MSITALRLPAPQRRLPPLATLATALLTGVVYLGVIVTMFLI